MQRGGTILQTARNDEFKTIQGQPTKFSFDASDRAGEHVTIDATYVQRVLADTVKDEDLSRYVL